MSGGRLEGLWLTSQSDFWLLLLLRQDYNSIRFSFVKLSVSKRVGVDSGYDNFESRRKYVTVLFHNIPVRF